MIKRIINKQGLFLRDDFTFDEATEIGLDVEPAQGLYLPLWDFESEKWVEGGTAPLPVIVTEPVKTDAELITELNLLVNQLKDRGVL